MLLLVLRDELPLKPPRDKADRRTPKDELESPRLEEDDKDPLELDAPPFLPQ